MSDRRRPIQGQSAGKRSRPAPSPGAKAKNALSTYDRFYKHRVFSLAGARLIREHGGRGSGLAADLWHVLYAGEDAKTGTVQRGREYLARTLGVDDSQLHKALKVLKQLGFLKLLEEGRADHSAAVYQLFAYPADKELPKHVLPRTVRPDPLSRATPVPGAQKPPSLGQVIQKKTPTVSSSSPAGAAGLRPAVAGLRPDGPAFKNPEAARAVLSALRAAGPAGLDKSGLLSALRGVGVGTPDGWEVAVFDAVEYGDGNGPPVADLRRPDFDGFVLTAEGGRVLDALDPITPTETPPVGIVDAAREQLAGLDDMTDGEVTDGLITAVPPEWFDRWEDIARAAGGVPRGTGEARRWDFSAGPATPATPPEPVPVADESPERVEEIVREKAGRGKYPVVRLLADLLAAGIERTTGDLRALPYLRVFRDNDGYDVVRLLRTAEPTGTDPADWIPYILERRGGRMTLDLLRWELAQRGMSVTNSQLTAMPVDVDLDPESIADEQIVKLIPRSRRNAERGDL